MLNNYRPLLILPALFAISAFSAPGASRSKLLVQAASLYDSYTIAPITPPMGDYHYYPEYLNDSGAVVGRYYKLDDILPYRVFVSQAGNVANILNWPRPSESVIPVGLNNKGELLLWGQSESIYATMYLGNMDGPFTSVPTLEFGINLNDRGETLNIGGSLSSIYHFKSRRSAPLKHLKGDGYAWPQKLNSRGHAIGVSLESVDSSQRRVVVWNAGGIPRQVWTGFVNEDWSVDAFNDNDEFVLQYRDVDDNGNILASRSLLVTDNGFAEIQGAPRLLVWGMNNNREIIATGSENQRFIANLFIRDGSPFHVQDLLPTNSEWSNLSPMLINNKGQIAGFGRLNGELRLFLMTPKSTAP